MKAATVNQLLATNLARLMQARGLNQERLAAKCGMGQTTVSLYLHPERRKPTATGKEGSAKLADVALMARALRVEVAELLRGDPADDAANMSERDREALLLSYDARRIGLLYDGQTDGMDMAGKMAVESAATLSILEKSRERKAIDRAAIASAGRPTGKRSLSLKSEK
jgi:transcriptional regulator with XRE-family HTH domain